MLHRYRIYRSIFISLVLTLACGVIALSFLLYWRFSAAMMTELGNMSVSTLQQTAYVLDDVRQRADALSSQLLGEANVITTMFRAAPTPLERYRATLILRRSRSITPFVDWLAVVDARGTRVDGTITLSPSAAASLLEIVHTRYSLRQSSFFLFTYPSPTTGKDQQSIVFCGYSDLSTGADDMGAVLIGISPSYFLSLIQEFPSRMDGAFLLLDADGDTITSSNAAETDAPNDLPQLGQALQRTQSGFFTARLDGANVLLSYASLSNLGWTLVNAQPLDEFHRSLDAILLATLLIAVAFCGVGLAFSLWLSGRVYRPVVRMLSSHGYISVAARDTGDEIGYLSGQLDRKQELESQARALNPILRDAALQQLITDWRYGVDAELLGSLGIALSGPFFAVVLIAFDCVDARQDRMTSKERDAARLTLAQIARGVFAPLGMSAEIVATGAFQLAALLQPDGGALPAELPLCLAELRTLSRQRTPLDVSSAVGPIVAGVDAINESYSAACELLTYRFFEGDGCILLPDDYRRHADVSPSELSGDALFQAVEKDDEEGVRREIDTFRAHLSTLAPNDAILSSYQLLMNARGIPGGDAQSAALCMRCMDDIGRCIRLAQLADLLRETFLRLARIRSDTSVFAAKPQEKDRLVLGMNAYIESHYADASISLESTAAALERSSAYLGRLYKAQSGHSFSEALSVFRLEQTEKLLLETDLSIQDICGKVGLANVNYFYTLFKKKHDCTPQNFRRRHR